MSKINDKWYFRDDVYFVTFNTDHWVRYFIDKGCCEIFLENIRLAKKIFGFELYAFIIMPDHFHADICPKGSVNISKIIQFIKRNTAREINEKFKNQPTLVEKCLPPVLVEKNHHSSELKEYKNKIAGVSVCMEGLFKWQSSFYDRRLRNWAEFYHTIEYINQKNLNDLNTKYHLLTEDKLESYPLYSITNPDLIDPY